MAPALDQPPRLLIVDDERSVTDTLVKVFLLEGFECRGAYSAEQALELISDWAPDLAILDVRLPQQSGIDLAIIFKAQLPNCRLVLFSGEIATADMLDAAARQGHHFDIFAKPTHPRELIHWARTGDPGDSQGPPSSC